MFCRGAFFQQSDDTSQDGHSSSVEKKQGLEGERRLVTGKLTDTRRTPMLFSVVTQGLLNPLSSGEPESPARLV